VNEQEENAQQTLSKIKSRGYWKVWLRPSKYVENRIESLSQCHEIMRECRVLLRGWDYPHISSRNPPYNGLNYIESFVDWQMYKDVWRLYQTGQFIHFSGIKEDWFEEYNGLASSRWVDTTPGTIFGYSNSLYKISEIYEFGARLAQKGIFGRDIVLTVELFGMEKRKLVSLDPFRLIFRDSTCRVNNLPFEHKFSVEEFMAENQKLALDHFMWIIDRFNLVDPPRDFFEREQKDFLKGKIR
jgi:hypothetical protein